MLNCNIEEFGAVGDGVTLNTTAIQAAIDACGAAGGGRVTIRGGRFLSGFLQMRSGVELHLAVDGVLLASADPADFPDIETDFWRTEYAPRFNRKCFLYAEDCHHIAITGRGEINCQGRLYCKPVPERKLGDIWIFRRAKPDSPARMVFFIGCQDILVEDVAMVEPASGWSYWICDCDRVHFDRVQIRSNLHYPNADGIHINCSRDVTVSNSTISCGDDAVICRAYSAVLRAPKPCERVTVTNCTLTSYCNAIRIGWYNDGVIRDCVFSNITITNSNGGIGIVLPTTPETGRGSDQGEEATLIENISFNNIVIDRHYFEPVSVKIEARCLVEAVRGISFSNIRSTSAKAPRLYGREDMHLQNISFSNCSFAVKPVEQHMDAPPLRSCNWGTGTDGTPTFYNIDDLTLHNTRFSM